MKKILIVCLGILMSVSIFAHAALVSIDDLGKGVIYIQGGFSDGSPAEGLEMIIVKDKPYNGPEDTFKGKEIIYKDVFDKDDSVTMPKPATKKYEVYINGGEGHIKSVKGIALNDTEKEDWLKAVEEFDFKEWKDSMISK